MPEAGPNATELVDPDEGDDTFVDPEAYLRDGDAMLPATLSGISGAWIGGLVAASTGCALAVVGLTLPWAGLSSSSPGRPTFVYVSDFGPVLGPAAAAVLVMSAMFAGVAFASRSRLGAILRSVTVLILVLGAVATVAITVYLVRGQTLDIVDQVAGSTVEITVQSVTPLAGAILYVFGAMLLALGTMASVRLPESLVQDSRTTEFAKAVAVLRTTLRWVMTLLALGLAVASIALPWYRQLPATGRSEGMVVVVTVRDIHLWQGTYRIGLIAGILLYVATLVAAQGGAYRAATLLRAIGMMVSTAVVAILLVGLGALRRGDPVGDRVVNWVNPALHAAAGYFVAIAAMIALFCSIALLSSTTTRESAATTGDEPPSTDEGDE
ncbi:hypothetical protein ACFP2T_35100 [Plantactinospora solaniradicis]|uniref:Uncharacterized protein n=1 Tax=Plantactinospora solaniradicis TaxID=1723736 RepID=A0ABW1KI16_9ACTN